MRRIVLASTSRYRQLLLQQLGIPFVSATPHYVENLSSDRQPQQLVQEMALGKAASLGPLYPDALIIGSDQVFVDGQNKIVGKPGSFECAFRQLRAMSGRRNRFYTGVALYNAQTQQSSTICSEYCVTLRDLTDAQIRAYLERECPFDCAGSFRIEGLGIALMSSLEGSDYTSLIGLPLIAVANLLSDAGIDVLTCHDLSCVN